MKWSFFHSEDLDSVIAVAKSMGWKDNKVQVRKDSKYFYVEPYEKDCRCPSIIKYNEDAPVAS